MGQSQPLREISSLRNRNGFPAKALSEIDPGLGAPGFFFLDLPILRPINHACTIPCSIRLFQGHLDQVPVKWSARFKIRYSHIPGGIILNENILEPKVPTKIDHLLIILFRQGNTELGMTIGHE